MTAMGEPARAVERPASSGRESRRLAEARERAGQRLARQRGTLRPLGWAVMLVVAAGTVSGHPAPGLQGKAAAVTLAVCVFVVTLALAIGDRFTRRGYGAQVAVLAAMGVAGVTLAALQPRGATELAAGSAVWMALARLPLALGTSRPLRMRARDRLTTPQAVRVGSAAHARP